MSDKLPLQSPNLVSQNIQRMAALFPNCITETAHGKAIDFDLLKQELNTDIIDGLKERYRLEWAGKREAIVTANIPTTNTLRPIKADSVNFDTTQNLYIEGDNLEVLKLLQESYLGKVKMIYIDPPYNTGNDFVYKDNFTIDNAQWKMDNEKDEYGQRLFVNPETSGRYHSDWLTMMYPRLKLARNLLTDDGVIFISIDDNEVHNLRKLCDEIFGEGNFVANIIWKKKYSVANDAKYLSTSHDYIILIAKSKANFSINLLPRNEEQLAYYKNPDNDKRGVWQSTSLSVSRITEKDIYPIQSPSGKEFYPPKGASWRYSKEKYQELFDDNRIWFGEDGQNTPRQKRFLSEVQEGITPSTNWDFNEVGHTDEGKKETTSLFNAAIFDYPKPVRLLKRIIQVSTNKDSIILDFFSGSATTAHAVMQLNAQDGGNRKFIMVQVPEATDEKTEAYKAGYKNICAIGKERIRRAGKKMMNDELKMKNEKKPELSFDEKLITHHSSFITDYGFRVYRLDSSNMQEVYYKPQEYQQENLDLFASNIKPDRTAEDLLAQVMLSWGLPLHYKIETLTIQGKQVFKVEEDSLFACFDNGIDEAFAKAIATHQPLRIVFKDDSFTNDTAKENVKQLLKQLSANTEMKVI